MGSTKARSCGHDVIQQYEYFLIVADSGAWVRILRIFSEHAGEEHVDFSISFDQVFQLLDVRVIGTEVTRRVEPFIVMSFSMQ